MTLTRLILINSSLMLLVVGNAEAAEIDVAVAANFTMSAKEMQRRLSRRRIRPGQRSSRSFTTSEP
ncbi:hypothetical protein [Bradyrhizobium paxllaeri]|uniref:hypothetical protein n=1 Tax=Bradyrhizobium paxllaeri TaxID=190148 RepID=UPI0008103F1B|nr:hypothetical protein [Bradyrhizobium paxllaeri]